MDKTDRINLLKGFLDEIGHLEYGQEANLDRLRRRARMIIANIYGAQNYNVSALNQISFHPSVGPVPVEYKESTWQLGADKLRNLFETLLEEAHLFDSIPPATTATQAAVVPAPTHHPRKVFVVHGHDSEMKESVARALEKLSLQPIVLHEQPSRGNTIIEKFEEYSDVGYAVVLLSPDDLAYNHAQSHKSARPRARQNVILELGYFLGRLGRNKVAALFREVPNFDFPSDYRGVVYIPFDDAGQWRFALITELQAAGYNIDANTLTKA